GTSARPDVRTHIPPLGASQNRRGTTSVGAPRLAEHPSHGSPVGRDRPPSLRNAIVTAPGGSGIWPGSQPEAIRVNLDPTRVKGLVWLGMPAGAYAAPVRFFGDTLGLEGASMRGTPWNLPPGTATGSSYSAPATAPSGATK